MANNQVRAGLGAPPEFEMPLDAEDTIGTDPNHLLYPIGTWRRGYWSKLWKDLYGNEDDPHGNWMVPEHFPEHFYLRDGSTPKPGDWNVAGLDIKDLFQHHRSRANLKEMAKLFVFTVRPGTALYDEKNKDTTALVVYLLINFIKQGKHPQDLEPLYGPDKERFLVVFPDLYDVVDGLKKDPPGFVNIKDMLAFRWELALIADEIVVHIPRLIMPSYPHDFPTLPSEFTRQLLIRHHGRICILWKKDEWVEVTWEYKYERMKKVKVVDDKKTPRDLDLLEAYKHACRALEQAGFPTVLEAFHGPGFRQPLEYLAAAIVADCPNEVDLAGIVDNFMALFRHKTSQGPRAEIFDPAFWYIDFDQGEKNA